MNRKRLITWGGGFTLVVLAFLITAQVVAAQAGRATPPSANLPSDSPSMSSASFQIAWDVIANGSGTMNSASYRLNSTLGQPAIGNMSSTAYQVHAGFWQTLYNYLFLPILQK